MSDPAQSKNLSTTADADAELWQSLQGGSVAQNPYVPFLTPKVVDRGGKKYLRMPKNQEMLNLAKFFDTHNTAEFTNQKDFLTAFFNYRNDERNYVLNIRKDARETAETNYTINKPYSSGNGSGFKDRLLTLTEAKIMGVPVGTKLSQVQGRYVPTGNTTSYNNFIKDANLEAGGMSRDPRTTYQDYLEAQQLINQHPDQFDTVRSDPRAAPYAHLLKPKSSNDLFDLFSSMLGGISVDTNQ